MADDDLSVLFERMIWIVKDSRQRVREHGDGLFKGNVVLSKILGRFSRIPLELGPHQRAASVARTACAGSTRDPTQAANLKLVPARDELD